MAFKSYCTTICDSCGLKSNPVDSDQYDERELRGWSRVIRWAGNAFGMGDISQDYCPVCTETLLPKEP